MTIGYRHKERPGFFVAHRSKIQLNFLSDEQKGRLFTALLDYSELGLEPDFGGVLGMAFATMAEQIDHDREAYEQRCLQNSANRAAALPAIASPQSTIVDQMKLPSAAVDRGDQPNPTQPNQTQPNHSCSSCRTNEGLYSEDFMAFWSAYPRKQGKKNAAAAFQKLQKQGIPLGSLLSAVRRQARSDQWQEQNGKFIPLASTWLNGARWEDEGCQPAAVPVSLVDDAPDCPWMD